jgi:hypothetical protein
MKPLRHLTAALLCVLVPAQPGIAQQMTQDAEVVIMPTGDALLHWFAHEGRTYFLQSSDPNDHLGTWVWSDLIDSGHDHVISHEVGGTADKGFFRLHYTDTPPPPGVTLEDWDADGDGLPNALELFLQTNPLNPDTSGDGIPDGWAHAHGLNPADHNADGLFQGGPATNLQAYQQGVQANPTSTIDDHDGDGVDNEYDAVPDDIEINWEKTSEVRYVWLEQVDEVDVVNHRHQPLAVNKHGQILFCDTRFPMDGSVHTGTPLVNDPKNLWNSATKEWASLPYRGSQSIDVLENHNDWHYDIDGTAAVLSEGQHIFNFNTGVFQFIDINDDGSVYGVSLGVVDLYIDPLIPGMVWKRTGTSLTQYAAPNYFYPSYPFPAAGGESTVHRNSPGDVVGAIANDGTINSFAYHAGANDWMTYDSNAFNSGTAASASMQRVKLVAENYDTHHTFPGAILDKDRALFVETINGQETSQSYLWLKEGGVQTDLSFMAADPLVLAEMSLAPNRKEDQQERLWITTGQAVFLEKRYGGNGENRWHAPPSMAEGAIRLNARGEAITATKLWRNGQYTDLNEVTSKPETVTITQAIDLASNGIILVQATENGVVKTGLLLPVEIQVRAPSDGPWMVATELKVAKWEKAWNSSGVFRNDFIDSASLAEIDRFRILVKGPLPEDQRSFFISSTGSIYQDHDDDPTELVLTKDPGVPVMGIPSAGFVSKDMILVADEADNRFLNDNMVDDQTHIVALGSDVEFRHGTAAGNPVAKIPVKKKATVNITSYILTPNGGIDYELIGKAFDDIRIAREIYTQIGLEITGTVQCVPIPAGVDLNDGLLLDTRETRGTLGTEALAVLDTYGTPTDHTDVIAIYVDAVIFTDQSLIGTCLGMAFPKGWSNAGNFKGTYLVSFEGGPITWSHELGHILLNSQGGNFSNHYNIPGNLMRETTVYWGLVTGWSHTVDTKRITQEQEDYISGSEFIKSLIE